MALSCSCAAACLIFGANVSLGTQEMQPTTSLAGMSLLLDQYYAVSVSADEDIISFLNHQNEVEETEESTEAEETTETESEETEEIPEETEAPEEPASYYDSVAISNVDEGKYVNVRTGPSTDYEIVGKIYQFCAATILDTIPGEDGDWYQIESGSVTGYIKAEFFLTGDEAEAIAREVGKVQATVIADCLRVREEPDLSDTVKILTLLPLGTELTVLEEGELWTKVQVDDDIIGYVYNDCIEIRVVFDTAISLEEEQAAIEEANRLREEYERQMALLLQQQQQQQQQPETQAPAQAETQAPTQAETQAPTQPETQAPAADTAATSQLRLAIVAYAKQFVGGPYVYGGTSLTGGIDCSGFTMRVYEHFGYSLTHHSGTQLYEGTRIDLSQVQPGDLVFYNSYDGGPITHVAMYIGDGQIVHASNETYGICIWNMYYRTPCAAARIVSE